MNFKASDTAKIVTLARTTLTGPRTAPHLYQCEVISLKLYPVVRAKLETFLPSNAKQFLGFSSEPQLFLWQCTMCSNMPHKVIAQCTKSVLQSMLGFSSFMAFANSCKYCISYMMGRPKWRPSYQK